MSPIEFAVSIFSNIHIGLTYAAIAVAVIAAVFVIYRLIRTR